MTFVKNQDYRANLTLDNDYKNYNDNNDILGKAEI